jgi:hypothetical protein
MLAIPAGELCTAEVRHPGEGRGPVFVRKRKPKAFDITRQNWIPAFAGKTIFGIVAPQASFAELSAAQFYPGTTLGQQDLKLVCQT